MGHAQNTVLVNPQPSSHGDIQDIWMQMMEMVHLLKVMEMLHLMYQIKARYKSISMFPRDIALDKKS